MKGTADRSINRNKNSWKKKREEIGRDFLEGGGILEDQKIQRNVPSVGEVLYGYFPELHIQLKNKQTHKHTDFIWKGQLKK